MVGIHGCDSRLLEQEACEHHVLSRSSSQASASSTFSYAFSCRMPWCTTALVAAIRWLVGQDTGCYLGMKLAGVATEQ